MATVIAKLLANKNLSINEVAKRSNVPVTTLANASKKPIESWSIRVLNAFAKGMKMKPAKLLTVLQPEEYELKIDDKKQTIQGVFISDLELYQQVRFAVQSEHLEGWNPTTSDIKDVLKAVKRPDPQFKADFERLFGQKYGA